MNGLDKIAAKITADSQTEITEILAAAKKEAAEIAERYSVLAQGEKDKILALGRDEVKEIARRGDSAAEQEMKKQLLATKQNLITKAFDLALAQLLSLPEQDYIALLAGLAAKASSKGDEEIILSAKDSSLGEQVLAKANELVTKSGKEGGLTLSETKGSFNGGLLLKSGDVEVNCTLDTLMRLSKEDLALDVADALFG